MSIILEHINTTVVTRKPKDIQALIKSAVDEGIEPGEIINQGLIPAMDEVGKQFAEHEIFVPEMLVSAMTMKLGLEVIKPLLKSEDAPSKGTIIMGTVKGDLHDIGKNLVTLMLEGAGFKVIDLGVDLTPEKLVDEVDRIRPAILGLSALLTTTMPEMEIVIHKLAERGLREKTKVLVGGAPVNKKFAEKIGADGFGADAAEAVRLARGILKETNLSHE